MKSPALNFNLLYQLLPTTTFIIALLFNCFQIDFNPAYMIMRSGLLFVILLWQAYLIIKTAIKAAEYLGEPLGGLLLTVSVTMLEGILLLFSLNNNCNFASVKQIVISVILTALSFYTAISLIVGGFNYSNLSYNLEGAKSYLAVISVLFCLNMVMPKALSSTGILQPYQIIVVSILCFLSYFTFMYKQNISHRQYFLYMEAGKNLVPQNQTIGSPVTVIETVLLLGSFVYMSEYLPGMIEHTLYICNLPAALSGLIVAILVLTPEGFSAISAAADNKLQRSINLCLGSTLATLSVTLPVVMLYCTFFLKIPVSILLNDIELILVFLSLFTADIAFSSRTTSLLYGVLLLCIFIFYLMALFI